MEMPIGQLYYRCMLCRRLILLLLLHWLPMAAAAAMPAYVLQLPESVQTVLVAETETATLHRFDARGDALEPGEQHRMSIGQNGVAKQRTGDRPTPLGIHFVVDELNTTNLHEKYGPVAFPLDYPNAWDSVNERTGYGIWIHGVTPGTGERPERDTDGCIALPNDQLLQLGPHLQPLQTPVIVTRRLQTSSRQETTALKNELVESLDEWTASFRDGDWGRYLALYADNFAYRGMRRDEWAAYRVHSAGARILENFTVSDVLLLADPEEDGLYLSRFRQQVTEAGQTMSTVKRLYWRRSPKGDLRIVAEDNG